MSGHFISMPLEEAMRTQMAMRHLKPDEVPEDLLMHLLDLAIRAPSGSNGQQWEFLVVRERRLVAEFARINRNAFRVGRWLGYLKPTEKNRKMIESVTYQADHFEEIPVLVVACLRGWVTPFPFIAVSSLFGSIYPAVQNLLLAARGAGLGAALITVPLWNQGKARKLLGLPRNLHPCCMIPLGWPLREYRPNKRRPVAEVVHFDRYGNRPRPPQQMTPGTYLPDGTL